MSNSIISEGKTTTEAIEAGLKQLKVSKDKVEIKVLENEDKRSFFSILTPRIVKVELKLKENVSTNTKTNSNSNSSSNTHTVVNNSINKETVKKPIEYDKNIEEIEAGKANVEVFLKDFLNRVDENLKYDLKIDDYTIIVNINGEASGNLIGYRGDTLNAIQTILSSIANKGSKEKIRLILDIENYREKREKVLEDLAQKVSKTVCRTGKAITLEPMTPYERKIIHSKLQENKSIQTYSIGEGDNRRVVIEKA